MRTAITFLAALLTGLLTGCQSADVGQTCQLDGAPALVAADIFESGRAECDALVCIKSPPSALDTKARDVYCAQSDAGVQCRPYCSKPCVSSSDCSPDETGLECRDVVLDEAFINDLKTRSPEIAQKFLPVSYSKYCAIPLP